MIDPFEKKQGADGAEFERHNTTNEIADAGDKVLR